MKKLLAILLLIFISIALQLWVPQLWWLYLVLGVVVGALLPFSKWKASPFASGFVAGAIVWVGASLLIDITTEGSARHLMADLLLIPSHLVVLAQGALGGLLLGLAVHTGSKLFVANTEDALDLPA